MEQKLEYISEEREEVRTNNRKPKDPLYFKKYYQTKMKGVKYHCAICNKSVSNDGRSAHFKTQKHILNQKHIETAVAFIALTNFYRIKNTC